MRRHVNRSGVIALIALVAALTGSSYAAGVFRLAPASVGANQLERGAVTAAKLASGSVTNRAIRRATLVGADLAAGASAGPAGATGRTGSPGGRGPVGLTGLAGATGAAGRPGLKGADGDPGSAPTPSSATVGTLGNVEVAANDQATGTVACPAGKRVLCRAPSGLLVDRGSSPHGSGVRAQRRRHSLGRHHESRCRGVQLPGRSTCASFN